MWKSLCGSVCVERALCPLPLTLTLGRTCCVEGEQLIQRSTLFEGARTLLIIELEKDGIAGEAGKCLRMRAWPDANVGANSG